MESQLCKVNLSHPAQIWRTHRGRELCGPSLPWWGHEAKGFLAAMGEAGGLKVHLEKESIRSSLRAVGVTVSQERAVGIECVMEAGWGSCS